VQTTGEPVENIDPSGGFDKESFAFYAYEQHDGTKLTFQLTVSDGEYTSTDEVVVTVGVQTDNQAPIAEAGDNQSVKEGTEVTLNGSGSDPDGDTLTMTWEQTAGTSVTLIDGTFTAPQVTSSEVLIFTLTVSDNKLSSTDTVHITVNNIADTDTKPIIDKDSSGGSVGWFALMFCVLFILRQKNLKRP
jgi:hypothetical protein